MHEVFLGHLRVIQVAIQGRLAVPAEHLHRHNGTPVAGYKPVNNLDRRLDMGGVPVFLPEVDDVRAIDLRQ